MHQRIFVLDYGTCTHILLILVRSRKNALMRIRSPVATRVLTYTG